MPAPRLLPLAVCLAASCSAAAPARADVQGFTPIVVDLTHAKDAAAKAEWSDPDLIVVRASGLGWGTAADEGSRDFWLQTTKPIAIGESWRAPISARLRVTVEQAGAGQLYARYSPDAKHWSTWQPLESGAVKEAGLQAFTGELRVPYREQSDFREAVYAYSKRQDVPWASDEEALVRELVEDDPEYFGKQLPFIGYLQLLYETQLYGGQPVRSIKGEVSWGIGGTHAVPKDQGVYKDRSGPWRYKAE